MDDNFEYAKDNILRCLQEACDYSEELYSDELQVKLDEILASTETKVKRTIQKHCRTWVPPNTGNSWNEFRT